MITETSVNFPLLTVLVPVAFDVPKAPAEKEKLPDIFLFVLSNFVIVIVTFLLIEDIQTAPFLSV